jgi:hypothetical protein
MDRRFKIAGLLSVAAFCIATAASAGIPDPALSTVKNVVVCPDGTIPYSVTIVGTSGPINNALVELRYTANGNSGACWCTVQTHPIISATTNASGVATFNIRGGHCLNPATISGGIAVEVYVNSIKLKEVGQVSPDVIAGVTEPPCQVTLADATNFTAPLSTSTYGFCFDLNSDGGVTLSDAILFTPPASNAASCN